MSDLSRHLPLSSRERHDESSVSPDWSKHTGATLLQIAGLLDTLGEAGWAIASTRQGFTIRDVAGHIAWRIGTPVRIRAAAVAKLVVTAGRSPRAANEQLARAFAAQPTAELAATVRELAVEALAGRAGSRIGDLEAAVVGAFDIASAIDALSATPSDAHSDAHPIVVDPVASGAVALRLAVSAPLPLRAVLRERALVAADADWSVGRGVPLRATAAGIILFLAGRNAATGRLPDAAPDGPDRLVGPEGLDSES